MSAYLNRIAIATATVAVVLAPLAARADRNHDRGKHNPFSAIKVGGTSADGNVFSGTMDVLGFVDDGGVVKAIGSVTGTITQPSGAMQQVTNAMVLMPVDIPGSVGFGGRAPVSLAAPASCQILHLDLGPLDLNLLGLVVHLDEVVLDISAQPGPGNLLGNLLCAITNLLNGVNLGNILGNAITNVLTTLLNNLLAAL